MLHSRSSLLCGRRDGALQNLEARTHQVERARVAEGSERARREQGEREGYKKGCRRFDDKSRLSLLLRAAQMPLIGSDKSFRRAHFVPASIEIYSIPPLLSCDPVRLERLLCRLIYSQEDGTTERDPDDARSDAREEDSHALFAVDDAESGEDGGGVLSWWWCGGSYFGDGLCCLFNVKSDQQSSAEERIGKRRETDCPTAQHDAGFAHVERGGDASGDPSCDATACCCFDSGEVAHEAGGGPPTSEDELHSLVHGELEAGEGDLRGGCELGSSSSSQTSHLASDGATKASVEALETGRRPNPLCNGPATGSLGRRLTPLLDDFCWYSDQACRLLEVKRNQLSFSADGGRRGGDSRPHLRWRKACGEQGRTLPYRVRGTVVVAVL